MTGRLRAALLGVGLLAILAPAAAAQPSPVEITGVDTSDHPEVTLDVTAPAILVGQDVPPDAFEVTEDGLRRRVALRRLPADDLTVVLAVDTSGSMSGEPLEAAMRAATSFLDAVPPQVRIAVVGFGSEVTTAAGFTTDREELREAIGGLVTRGETALYDGLAQATKLLASEQRGRRLVVLVSDGGDTVSTTAASQVVAQAADLAITIEAVSLQTPETDAAALQRLASDTGGSLAATTDPAALEELYAGIASQLVNRFELRYTSESEGATEVQVRLDHGGVAAVASRTLQMPAAATPTSGRDGAIGPSRVVAMIPNWLALPWLRPAASAAVFAGLCLLFLLLMRPRSPRTRLAAAPRWIDRVPLLGAATDQAMQAADRHLDRDDRRSRLDVRLEAAGVTMRPAEYLVLVGCGVVFVIAASLLLAGPVLAVALGVAAGGAARLVLAVRTSRRLAAFTDDLPDTLQLMSGSLRAGHGLVQAIDAVSRQADEPTAGEFHRVLTEVRLGRDLDHALESFAARMDVDDVKWVVQAMQIHREVGGDLAEVLDNVAATVRERAEVRGQVKALTAQGRLSAVILVALPFFMAGALAVLKPGYLNEFGTHPIGYVMVGMGAVLMTLGGLWIKRLVRLVY